MTVPTVRRLAWEFDDSTPFQWMPANPQFGLVMNFLSFVSLPFERFVVASVRNAMPRITDPVALEEADAFLRQEALHAKAHRAHTAALIAQHPALGAMQADLVDRFAPLYQRPLPYQLAYTADIEATFTPFFNTLLRHRDGFFDGGDPAVASLFLWHLVEEIEHRSSAQIVYDAVVPSPWFRLRSTPMVFAHMFGCFNAYCRAVDEVIPRAERGCDASEMLLDRNTLVRAVRRDHSSGTPAQFASVSRREIVVMIGRLVRSQAPGHTPVHEETPPFADEWFAAFDDGRDVTHWYDAAGIT